MFVFSVSPLFRLRVSHHLDHAPFPHPAHRTGRADLPHTAFGQGLCNGDSHTFAHEPLSLRSLKLVQSQLLVQVLVSELLFDYPHLKLRAQPLTHPVAGVAVDIPVGFADRSDAKVIGPTAKFAVDSYDHILYVPPRLPSCRQLIDCAT